MSSTIVARQPKTLIRSNLSTRKTAWLDLTSGPQPLQGTGKYGVKSDLPSWHAKLAWLQSRGYAREP